MRVGIAGYPGSGKTTVFQALAAHTWSERGVTFGKTEVPDPRIDRLAAIFQPKRKVYAEIVFVDLGGGGRHDTGAFPPEVVQNMRNADVLVHVVRGFENPMLGRSVDLKGDVSKFSDELCLLDLSVLEKRHARFQKEAKKDLAAEVTRRAVAHLEGGEPLRTAGFTDDEAETLRDIQLLSLRPLITLYNLGEKEWADPACAPLKTLRETGKDSLEMALSGQIEAEIAALPPEEQTEFLQALGLGEPAKNEFIRAAYRLLDLVSFLTAGPDECRAWPIRRGLPAPRAAGKVHSDIERGFIRAEVYRLEDLEAHGTEAALKQLGKLRVEGKTYIVHDGDVVNFRFNV